MKKNVLNVLIAVGFFVVSVVFALILLFTGDSAVAQTPVRKKDFSGVSANVVSVFDVHGVMKMTAVNYLPNEFAGLNETVSDANDGANPAKRGTYRFYIDTLTNEEWAQRESLDRLLKPDGNWHLTMYLPPVFSACSVFVQYESADYVGSIDRYNIQYYLNYSSDSEFDDAALHQTATKPMFLDIPISSDGKYSKECKVTIHYETDNANFVGFFGPVLIGEDAAVHRAVNVNRSVLLAAACIAAGTLLLFLLICILKRSFPFVPQLLFAVGIFLALFSSYALFGYTGVPYLMSAIRRASLGFILFGAALYLPKKIGKVPVLYLTSAAVAVATVLATVSSFCTTVAAYTAVCYSYIALAFVCIVVLLGFTVRDICKNAPLGLRLNTVIAGVATVFALFSARPVPFIMLSPAFWLYLGELGVTFVLGLREFITAEIHNRYLTTNLEQEVERQTQSLQNILAERDNILLYVSHDMKKTVLGMGNALTDLRQNLSTPELLSKADYILQKNAELKKNLAEIGKYGKQNYVAEQSEIINLSTIVRAVAEELRPDCEANGILLSVTLPERLDVYAKKVALQSVILNLILNAIEHSFCEHLYVSVTKRKGFCRLDVADDGHGVTLNDNIFAPYVTSVPSDSNSGLGLYLAKTAIEAMHGELTFERKNELTVFSATLPLA